MNAAKKMGTVTDSMTTDWYYCAKRVIFAPVASATGTARIFNSTAVCIWRKNPDCFAP